jgi:death-on-curing family protein
MILRGAWACVNVGSCKECVMDYSTLSVDEVISIHNVLVQDFSSTDNPIVPPGIRSMALLDSAVNRQSTVFGNFDKYATIHENAATLLFGICCDHPFHNGNKRTALVAMLAHLDKNKRILRGVSHGDLFDLVIALASHNLLDIDKCKWLKYDANLKRIRADHEEGRIGRDEAEIQLISHWIRSHWDVKKKFDRTIKYGYLERILKRFDYFFDNQKGNAIDIVKYEYPIYMGFKKKVIQKVWTISYSGEKREVALPVIKEIRRRLKLDDANGIDSSAFYDFEACVDGFCIEYAGILKRLANK